MLGQDDYFDYLPIDTDIPIDIPVDVAIDYTLPDYQIPVYWGDTDTMVTDYGSLYDFDLPATYGEIYATDLGVEDVSYQALQAQVQGGSGFLDIFKSILGIASPLITSILRKGQPATTTLPKTSTGIPTGASLGAALSGFTNLITSNPLLLAGIGVGGYLLLRKKKVGGTKRRRKTRR